MRKAGEGLFAAGSHAGARADSRLSFRGARSASPESISAGVC